jgi:hypothetical protein
MKKLYVLCLLTTFGWLQASNFQPPKLVRTLSTLTNNMCLDRTSLFQEMHDAIMADSEEIDGACSPRCESDIRSISPFKTVAEDVIEKVDCDFTFESSSQYDMVIDNGIVHITPHFIDNIDPVLTIKVINPKNRIQKDEKYKNSPLLIHIHNEQCSRK